jgi:hypothetical protein
MLALAGCPLLLAGSLAGSLGYEAYKYKKTRNPAWHAI